MPKVYSQLNKKSEYKCSCGETFRTKYNYRIHQTYCLVVITTKHT